MRTCTGSHIGYHNLVYSSVSAACHVTLAKLAKTQPMWFYCMQIVKAIITSYVTLAILFNCIERYVYLNAAHEVDKSVAFFRVLQAN